MKYGNCLLHAGAARSSNQEHMKQMANTPYVKFSVRNNVRTILLLDNMT